MSLEDLLIARRIACWLLPDESVALADLLERVPLPAPAGCIVPLVEFRRRIAARFGEVCVAAQQLGSLVI